MAAELTVEVRDLGGASKHATQLAADLSEAVSKTRFLGRAEVPLASTLSATSGEPLPQLLNFTGCVTIFCAEGFTISLADVLEAAQSQLVLSINDIVQPPATSRLSQLKTPSPQLLSKV